MALAVLVFRGVLAVVVAVALAVLLAIDKELFASPDWLQPWAGWGAAVGGVLGSADSFTQNFRKKRLQDVQVHVAVKLTALRHEIHSATAIENVRFGLALYVPAPFSLPRRQRLISIHEDRRAVRPVRSGIRWRVGKGVIGLSIQTKQEVIVDLQQLDEQYENLGESGWKKLSSTERLGLTAREMDKAKGKYSVVYASPVFRGSKAIGCIALDAPPGSRDQVFVDRVRLAMSSAALAVSDRLHT